MSVSMRLMSAGDGYKYLLRTVAAADGELWNIRVTTVPEPAQTRGYIEAALKQRGYTLDFRSGQTNPPAFATSYEVKQPNGVSKRMTVDQIKALAYEKS